MPKKRASSRSASSVSSSGSASSSLNVNATMSSSTTTTSTGGDESESSSPSSGINNLPTTGGVIGGIQLTPAMIREFMEASKKAGIDLHAGVVNERGNMRHVTGDLNKLVAMTNASSNHAAAAAAAAQAAANNNNIINTTARGKVTGVKIVRQTVPFVGPPLPPGHVSSSSSSTTSTSSQKGGKKTLAMGVSATFSKPDGSTATVELDPAAIAAMMAQANSNNPEAFNAGLKQILAAATTTTACAPVTYAGTAQQQQQQQQRIMDSSRRVMSSSATGTTTRNSLLANKIASSYGGSTSEDDNTKNNISSSKTTSSTKKSSINNNNNSQQQQNMAQMQSLFASLFSMAQQMDSSSSSSSTSSSSQDPLQNEFALFRKAAFVAGVNVAIQQEAEREAQHEMEKMNKRNQQQQQQLQQQQQKNKTDASQQQGIKQKQQQQQQQQQKSKKKESATGGNHATSTAKSNVFSMIFGGGGNKSNATSATAPTTSSTTSSSVSTNNGSSSTRNSASSSTTAVVPVIPPPPGGFPQDSLVSQAASVLADYGNDDDKNLNLAVSLGNRLLKSVNMSLETEDDARRAYEKVTSCLSPEERSIVDSFATNFVDLPDNNNEGGAGAAGGFGCSPEELINVMSKSMASVMNLDNPGVIARLAQEIDRVKRNNNPPLPQDRPTFEHLPPDDADKAQKISREKKQKAEEEELRKRNEEEEAEAEEEERKRELKASKRRDKKARQKERLKKEAEVKAAAAAIKKREKTITSWRSRVIAACLSGDARKMDLLIGESPYKNYIFNPSLSEEANDETNDEDGSGGDDYGGGGGGGPQNQEEYMVQQLNWFLPNCLQKYPTRGASFDTPPFQFNVARELLAKYIISTSFDVFRQPVPTFSRTSIHSAAYANDVDFIKWVLHSSKDNERDFLESQCTDAGWTPLHYATAGGAKSALELLLSEKCNVKARSTPSLTCFRTFTPYQSSNGITARELAVVLQAGAVDDDLTSKAAILDEIVDKRIVNASAADKSSYMRILKSIEERLKEVEKNGYWPLPEDEEQIALIFEETASESTPTLKKKSKKKNKKKSKESNLPSNSAAASASSTAEAEGASNEKSSSGGDLSDPVAVALLSMGFAEDQIKAAAKAFGGYVGADDMVMWILSGGDVSAIDQTNTNSQQTSPTRKESVSVTSSSTKSASAKTQPKALTRAQKKAEEAARKRQEEIANAQKAAAKREEQRRLRREWNEREQARQQEEKNAKLAKALEKQRQAEMEKIMAEMPKGPPGPGGIPMSINIGGGGGGGGGAGGSGKGGPPITIVAGGKKSSKKSNMGIPQAPTVKAPKILARPNDASKSSVGDQPLFAKPAPSKSSSRASKPSNSSTHQPTVILKKGNKSQSAQKGFSASAPEYHPPSVSDVSISLVRQILIRYDAYVRSLGGSPMSSWYQKSRRQTKNGRSSDFRDLIFHSKLSRLTQAYIGEYKSHLANYENDYYYYEEEKEGEEGFLGNSRGGRRRNGGGRSSRRRMMRFRGFANQFHKLVDAAEEIKKRQRAKWRQPAMNVSAMDFGEGFSSLHDNGCYDHDGEEETTTSTEAGIETQAAGPPMERSHTPSLLHGESSGSYIETPSSEKTGADAVIPPKPLQPPDYASLRSNPDIGEDIEYQVYIFKCVQSKTQRSIEKTYTGRASGVRDNFITNLREYFLLGSALNNLSLMPEYLIMRGKSLKSSLLVVAQWREARKANLYGIKREPDAVNESWFGGFCREPQPSPNSSVNTFFSLALNILSCFLYMMNYYIVGPSSVQYANALGAKDAMSGLIIGAMPWAALVSAVIFSIWSNKSYRSPLLASGVLLIAGNILYSSAYRQGSIVMALCGRFLTGLGGPRSMNRRYIADTTPLVYRTAANAAFGTATALGAAVGPAIAVLLDNFDFQLDIPLYGTFYFNGMTGPGFLMSVLWLFYFILTLFMFQEPVRSGLLEQVEKEKKKELAASNIQSLPTIQTYPSEYEMANLERGDSNVTNFERGDSIVTNFERERGDSIATNYERACSIHTEEVDGDCAACPVENRLGLGSDNSQTTFGNERDSSFWSQVGFMFKHMTPAVHLCMFLIFSKQFTVENLISGAAMVTKNRYGWGLQQVGALGTVVGCLTIPISVFVGWISQYREDGVLMVWLITFATIGMGLLIDPTDFVSADTDTYNEGDIFAVGPRRYYAGYLLVFCSVQAFDGVVGSVLSKVIPTALAAGTLNSGLLATIVGTLGRAVGDAFITAVGYINVRQVQNLLFVPSFLILATDLVLVLMKRENLTT